MKLKSMKLTKIQLFIGVEHQIIATKAEHKVSMFHLIPIKSPMTNSKTEITITNDHNSVPLKMSYSDYTHSE